jgi:ketosteroid isomerase-like protein
VVPLYAPLNVSVENNIEVVRRLGEALSSRDWAAFEEFVAEDCEWTTLIGQDDVVTNEWSARGTHDGPLPRADGHYDEPTGRFFARTGVGIVELRDGKIVRYRDHFDRQTMAEQLGLD